MTKDEAVQLAKELERVDSARKQLNDQLKEYVKHNGAIDTGEKIWSFHDTIKWEFTADQLRKLAENIVLDGKNPWELLNITNANLKKLDWTDEAISQFGTKKIGQNFKGVKSKK
ncbi:hypothetical protein D7X33_48795, partial [Butyricicoccus sp. 1XD8-22]